MNTRETGKIETTAGTKRAEELSGTSADFLLHEYEHFAELFWRNEETGEKRLTFFVTLVTAVITALVTLTSGNNPLPAVARWHLYTYSLFVLLLLGWLLLLRMIQRRRVTDEYKNAMDTIRDQFRRSASLSSYDPLPGKEPLFNLPSTWANSTHDDDKDLSDRIRKVLSGRNVLWSLRGRIKTDRTGKEREFRVGRHEALVRWSCQLMRVFVDTLSIPTYRVKEKRNHLEVYRVAHRGFLTGSLVEVVEHLNNLIFAALITLSTAGPLKTLSQAEANSGARCWPYEFVPLGHVSGPTSALLVLEVNMLYAIAGYVAFWIIQRAIIGVKTVSDREEAEIRNAFPKQAT